MAAFIGNKKGNKSMGMKGNIYIKHSPTTGVYLYSNQKGDLLPKILQSALIRGRERWGDTPSLTRIIFAEMTQKSLLENTGFGISPILTDNENFLLVVDDKKELVGIFSESGHAYKKFTFNQFLAIGPERLDWRNLSGYNIHEGFEPNLNKGDPYPM